MYSKLLLILLITSSVVLAENYKKVKINFSTNNDIIEIQKMGIALDDAYQNRDGSIDVFINESEFQNLSKSDIKYEVLIDNWESYYKENRAKKIGRMDFSKSTLRYEVKNFTYGSMGGYYTLAQVWEKIDSMIAHYPNLISFKDSIGASDEGRPIYAVRISDNPNINEDEPEVLYTALIHAREPESMMQMIYYMLYLLENYGTNTEVTYLVDNREMYFIPVVNPDGYYYNESTNPDGGGMWRKNRQYNIDGSYGVDLNRNFGHEWGFDDSGSSPSPTSNTYRGTGPFSEPETETIRQYCNAHNFKLALNYHTYSNLLITPWGYKPEATPDSIFYSEIATDMTQFNNYNWGYSAAIIYAVNGDSDDWFYGEQTEKNKIFAMTPEVGSNSDGFWPDQDRIIPLAEENVYPNLYLAWVAGGFANTLGVRYDEEYYSAGDTGSISLKIKNKGLEEISSIKVKLAISDNAELISGSQFEIGNINARTEVPLENYIQFSVKQSAIAGDSVRITLKYYSQEVLLSTDNYAFAVGLPKVVFYDSFNTLDNWSTYSNGSKKWELTSTDFYSSDFSLTESKSGTYLSNTKTSITTVNKISLLTIAKPYLKFKTKYNIEAGWDYGQVLVSTDSVNWVAVGGQHAKIGTGSFQPYNQFVYDGFENDWITEIINLADYSREQIFIKFELNSDEYVEEDGWYIDDLEIFEYTNSIVSVVGQTEIPSKYELYQNYPNPFNPSTTIKYSIPSIVGNGHAHSATNVSLKIYDILGREVATLVSEQQKAGNYEVHFDASNLTSGIYYYQLKTNSYIRSKKMVLIK